MHLVWSMKAATHSGKSHSDMYLLKKHSIQDTVICSSHGQFLWKRKFYCSVLMINDNDYHWIFLLHMRWLCAKIWLKTGTVTCFTACLCLEFHITSFRVFKVPQGLLCASVPQYLTPWRHILASDHKVPHDQILLLNNISRKVLMSSADHILNPLCPVFQVSNFLPEHRTLKQAVK